ncbi:MAG TPA: creatininase family protein, partial [Longimicrobiales bacterium]|nr:creatininase family protein [Longimicrobiales bacterium]
MLTDVARSLEAHGFTDIILVGDSGGNQAGMRNVADAMNALWTDARAHYIPEFYEYAKAFEYMETELGIREPVNDGLHDDFVISSIMLAHDPSTVRFQERVRAGRATINGLSLEPLEEVQEIGRKLLAFRVDHAVKAIRASLAEAR